MHCFNSSVLGWRDDQRGLNPAAGLLFLFTELELSHVIAAVLTLQLSHHTRHYITVVIHRFPAAGQTVIRLMTEVVLHSLSLMLPVDRL